MSATIHDFVALDDKAHLHRLLDEAKVPREMPAGRTAGLIERVSWLSAEVKRLRKLTAPRAEAHSKVTP